MCGHILFIFAGHQYSALRFANFRSEKNVLPRTEAKVPGTLASVFGRTGVRPQEGIIRFPLDMSLQNVISLSGIWQVSCPSRACRCVSSRGCSGCVSIRPELLCLPLCTCGCQGAERHTWCRTSCGCGRESR